MILLPAIFSLRKRRVSRLSHFRCRGSEVNVGRNLGALAAAAARQANARPKNQEQHNPSRACDQRYHSDRLAPFGDVPGLIRHDGRPCVHQEGTLQRRR